MQTLQNILVIVTVLFAVGFLVRKFIWKPKKKATKSCGSDGCSC